jgi:hypothetical protein
MVIIGWSLILLICGINYWAIQAGEDRYRAVHNAASVCGVLGFVSLAAFALAFLDLFFQIWVKRPGYEGWPVTVTEIAIVLFTTLSLILAAIITLQDHCEAKRERNG